MSGIFGYFRPGGPPIAEPVLTPAPVRHASSGCCIVADARVDYRGDLCRTLLLDPAMVGDDALILAAYLRWGDGCLDHLLGDFAFAIWDPRDGRLFCARDHFGMRPFYYHHAPGARFVFASDARDIFRVPAVPYEIDEGRVADYLVPELEWIDYTSTFYRHVHRLPPGHKLTTRGDGIAVSEYWAPVPGPALTAMPDREWIDGFAEVLTRAVEERLHVPAGKAGCMLSGGMDSGSVAALAQELLEARGTGPLHTVSAARGAGEDCVETRRIHATVARLGATATILYPDGIAAHDGELAASIEEPFDGDFLFMKAIFLAARDVGFQALLDGGGGDVVLNEGSYVTRLVRRGRLITAIREMLAEPTFWGASPRAPELLNRLLKAAAPERIKRMTRARRRRTEARRFVGASLIGNDFARRVKIEERCERMYAMFPADWTADAALERIRKIRPNVSAGRERYARLARFAGIEARDPFLDLNVVRFCAQVPGHLLLHHGWPKYILREAMAGRLPDEVRWGRGKPHVGWAFSQQFLRRELGRGNLSLDRMLPSLRGYVDGAALERSWLSFQGGQDFEAVGRAYVLSLWLAQASSRPIAAQQATG
jgi:asparagine synthase (glutamine-hydrolysing)